jgi:hypothetical protein
VLGTRERNHRSRNDRNNAQRESKGEGLKVLHDVPLFSDLFTGIDIDPEMLARRPA